MFGERVSPHATADAHMNARMVPPGTTTALPAPAAPTPTAAMFSSASSASAAAPAHAFIKLCLLWTALHRTSQLPPACQGALSDNSLKQIQIHHNIDDILEHINSGSEGAIFMVNNKEKTADDKDDKRDNAHYVKRRPNYDRENHMKFHYRYTTRSLSVIAVLAGIVFILFVVAITTCIRNRRSILMDYYQNPSQDSFTRQILIDHLRHLSSSRRAARVEPPPNYDEVVKRENADGGGDDDDAHEPPSYVEAMENQERIDAEASSASSPGRARRQNSSLSLSNDNCALRKTSMIAIQQQLAMPSISEETATVHKAAAATTSDDHVVQVIAEEK